MNIEKEIDQLIDHEGGFVDDPDDNGGATKIDSILNQNRLFLRA